jgi:ketosteroid isomerase-like protein
MLRPLRKREVAVRHMIVFAAACLVPTAVVALDRPEAVPEVLALNSRLEGAIARGDAAEMALLFAPEFRLQNSANRVLTGEQVLRQVRSGATRFSDYRRSVEAAYQSGDVVILMGEERVTPAGGLPATRRFTSVWRRTQVGWRQIARQSTNIVVSP